ncbi:MAG: hypothetical protein JST50_09295 [Bacteroidetes bacterium]|nr:hypothetical protein [Bacteroidota bacterium]
MRSAVLIIIAIAICSVSCKKSSPVSPTLFGKWELRHSYGGLAGFDSVYKAGNGNILQFSSDSTYKRFEANKLAATGVFHIKHYTNPDGYAIYFDNITYGDAFSRNGTTMTIGTTVTDGIASDYQKISD